MILDTFKQQTLLLLILNKATFTGEIIEQAYDLKQAILNAGITEVNTQNGTPNIPNK